MAKKKNDVPKNKKTLIVLLFLIFIVALFGAYFFFFYEAEPQMTAEPVEAQVVEVEPALPPVMTRLEEPEEKEEKPAPVRRKARTSFQKGYYVRVKSCQYVQCTLEVKRQLKASGIPEVAFNKVGKTRYYHLVSTMAFVKPVAKRKAALLTDLNKMPGNPTVIPHKDMYRISMGFFLERDKALYMQSYMDQFHAHSMTYFVVEPTQERFRYTNVYAGPFRSRKKAERILQKLEQKRLYFSLKVIENPKRDNCYLGTK